MDVDRALVDDDVVAPDLVEQLLAREELSGVESERDQEPELLWTQIEFHTIRPRPPARGVDPDLIAGDDRRNPNRVLT